VRGALKRGALERGALEWVLGLTSFAAGAVDVTSFAKLGGVLASAMTGNIALLGLYLGRNEVASALGSVVALIAFIAGTAAAAWAVRQRVQNNALKLLLAAELVLLVLGTALWLATGRTANGVSGDGVIVLLALAMGVQIIAGRQLNMSGIPTVVFTSTLTNIIVTLTDVFARKDRKMPPDVARQCAALVLYFAGALAAGVCVYTGVLVPMVLPIAAVGAALMLLP
jgi:uncharacterized membrane protein YoaK (UPF0700 family)